MDRHRFRLECPHCGQEKLVEVAVSADGMMGPVKCDDCKARGFSMRARRPARRADDAHRAREGTPEPQPSINRVLRRFGLSS
jgi:hypothetical protein